MGLNNFMIFIKNFKRLKKKKVSKILEEMAQGCLRF